MPAYSRYTTNMPILTMVARVTEWNMQLQFALAGISVGTERSQQCQRGRLHQSLHDMPFSDKSHAETIGGFSERA